MENPLVSICMSTYNCPGVVRRALDSCLNQTYKNIEVIVVDDSTDLTPDVIKSYAAKDSRIKYYPNEKFLGLAESFMRSYKLAQGEYIQHLSSDEWMEENFIEEKLWVFKEYPNTAFVSCGIQTFKHNSETNKEVFLNKFVHKAGIYKSEDVFNNFYRTNALIGLFCTARRRDVVEFFTWRIPNEFGYDNFYKRGKNIDVIVFLNILYRYKNMYYADKTFMNALIHDKNVAHTYRDKKTIGENIKLAHVDVVGFRYSYKNFAPQYFSRFKIYMGANILAGTFFDLILRRASGSPWKALKDFFSDYSLKDRLLSFLYFLPRIIGRIFQWIFRKIIPPKK